MLKKGVIYTGKHGATNHSDDFVTYKVLNIEPHEKYEYKYIVKIIDETDGYENRYGIGVIEEFVHNGCKDDKPCRELNVRELLKKLHENN